jgi:hypothetical protein
MKRESRGLVNVEKDKKNQEYLQVITTLKFRSFRVSQNWEIMISIPHPVLEYTEIHGCRPIRSFVFSFYNSRSPIGCVCKQ